MNKFISWVRDGEAPFVPNNKRKRPPNYLWLLHSSKKTVSVDSMQGGGGITVMYESNGRVVVR